MSCSALVAVDNRSRLGVQDEPVSVRPIFAEVEHVVQGARDRIGRPAADPAEIPIVFDES